VKERKDRVDERAQCDPRRGRGSVVRAAASCCSRRGRSRRQGDNEDQNAGIAIVKRRCRHRSVRSPRTPAPRARSSSARSWNRAAPTSATTPERRVRRHDREGIIDPRRSCAPRSRTRLDRRSFVTRKPLSLKRRRRTRAATAWPRPRRRHGRHGHVRRRLRSAFHERKTKRRGKIRGRFFLAHVRARRPSRSHG